MKKVIWVTGSVFTFFLALPQLASTTDYQQAEPYQVGASLTTSGTLGASATGTILFAAMLFGVSFALIILRILVQKMITVRAQKSAKEYEKELILSEKTDRFLYSSTSRQRLK